jgi:hypothetical protein
MKIIVAAIALTASAGAALADPHETRTFAGPYGVWGDGDERNTTLSINFTGVDGGTPYTANGLMIVLDMTALVDITFALDTIVRVTPPSGPTLEFVPSDEIFYTTIQDATVSVRLPAAVNPIGTWTFTFYDVFLDNGPDSRVSNVRISLQDFFPVTPPDPVTDLGVLASGHLVSTVPNYSGADVLWYKINVPQNVSAAGGLYVDIDTAGSTLIPGADEQPDNTMMAIYDAAGLVRSYNDDIYVTVGGGDPDPRSYLTFGLATEREHDGSPGVYDGHNGTLYAGDYYIASGAAYMSFGQEFNAGINGFYQGGTMVLNVYSNIGGSQPCSQADVGAQGGEHGSDHTLDNNDFIVFIDYFFSHDSRADFGIQGGLHGHDGLFDNNDFIAFVDTFFNDQAACAN